MKRLNDELGLTIVEVMVAVLLLVLGLGAAVAAFPAASHQTLTGQRNEQAAALAERELEALRSRPYANVAITSAPTQSTNGLNAGEGDTNNPRNPDFYVNGTTGLYRIKQDYHNSASAAAVGSPAAGEAMIVSASGVAHTSTVTVGGINMTVYRYVTDHRELCPINFGNTVADAVSNLVTGLLGGLLGTVNAAIGTNVNVLCSGAGEAGHGRGRARPRRQQGRRGAAGLHEHDGRRPSSGDHGPVRQRLRSESGFVVPVVVGVLALSLILVAVTAAIALRTTDTAQRDVWSRQAAQSADAGLDMAIRRANSASLDLRQVLNVNLTGQCVVSTNALLGFLSLGANGWCPAVDVDLGNGQSFSYYVGALVDTRTTTTVSCPILNVCTNHLLQRKVVSIGMAGPGCPGTSRCVKRRTIGRYSASGRTNLLLGLLSSAPSLQLYARETGTYRECPPTPTTPSDPASGC